jgi:hypothetical protein
MAYLAIALGADGQALTDASGPELPLQDQTAILREGTVASLIAYGVTANNGLVPVESERVDPVEDDGTPAPATPPNMPRIIVYADENAGSASKAGTAPAFDVTATLVIQALAQRAALADAVADLDAMIAQVKDCLFGDPIWVGLTQNVASVRVTRSLKGKGRRVLGDGRVMIECTWREIYAPRVVQTLSTITLTTNPPANTQPIAAGATIPTS